MSKIFRLFLLLLCSLYGTQAATTFPPATQAEVNAGTVTSKFVSPATLAGWSGGPAGSSNFVVLSAGDVDGTNKAAFNTIDARQYLHAAVITNHTAEPFAVGSGVLRIEGSNQFYFVNVLSNITINSGTSVLLRSNVTYGVWITNTTFTVATEATWQWRNTKSVSTVPSFQNGAYFLRLKRDFMGTNAWVETGPSYELGAGSNVYFTTNNGVVSVSGDLSNVPGITNTGLFKSSGVSTFTVMVVSNLSTPAIVLTRSGTNLFVDGSLGNVFYHGIETNTLIIPTNFSAGQFCFLEIVQTNGGTFNWFFPTQTWSFNVSPYLPIDTNVGRVSIVSGNASADGTRIYGSQSTGFR